MKLSKLQLFALCGVAVIGIGGGAVLWALSSRLDDVQDQIAQQSGLLNGLVGSAYYPSQENIDTLDANNETLGKILDSLRERMQSGQERLEGAVEKNAVVFKQEMADQLKGLQDEAAKNTVHIDPAAAAFGFGMYQNVNPSDQATPVLGRQLLGIEAVADALFRARISSLDAVRRTVDENGPDEPPTPEPVGHANGKGPGEALAEKIVSLPGGLYTLYPLEFEFTGSEESVREAMANLAASPNLLVTRFLIITSKRTAAPRLDDLAKTAQGLEKKPTFLIAMGNDELHVRARIDLVDWSGDLKHGIGTKP